MIQIPKARNFQFSLYLRKESGFLPEDAVNAPRNVEDATKCCSTGTRSARPRRGILGPARGSGEPNVAVGIVNRNK